MFFCGIVLLIGMSVVMMIFAMMVFVSVVLSLMGNPKHSSHTKTAMYDPGSSAACNTPHIVPFDGGGIVCGGDGMAHGGGDGGGANGC